MINLIAVGVMIVILFFWWKLMCAIGRKQEKDRLKRREIQPEDIWNEDNRNKVKEHILKHQAQASLNDLDVEDGVVSTKSKKEDEPKRCSFCGSENHTLSGCGTFIACISCG